MINGVHDRRCAPLPLPVLREGRGEGDLERKKSFEIRSEFIADTKFHLTFEITLTPTLSRSTGRGGRSAATVVHPSGSKRGRVAARRSDRIRRASRRARFLKRGGSWGLQIAKFK
jgi:hypothetical protein